MMNLEQFQATIELDDKTVVEDCHMVAFANARRYGTGAVLNTIGKLDDGLFEIYVLRELSVAGLAAQFFDHVDESASYCQVYQTSQVKIKLNRPQTFQIDGELMGEIDEVNVKIEAGCLRLII